MELKRFYADDMGRGIRQVKRALGPEAVILGSHRVGRQVEILAASDYDEQLYKELTASGGLTANGAAPASDSGTASLEAELAELRTIVTEELAQLSRLRETPAAQPAPATSGTTRGPRAVARERLEAFGLSPELCQRIAARFPLTGNDLPSWQAIVKLMGGLLKVEADEIMRDGGICALVGSTGVGKTTTVAKLAAQYVYRHGKHSVAIISTDSFRIGGQEQLTTFARVLGVEFATASSARELTLRLREFKHRSLILIDTAGMSQRDMLLAGQLQSLVDGSTEIKPYLVLSAASQLRVTQEIIDSFKQLPLQGAIVTKLDEAGTLGPVLSGLIRTKLPLTYTCDGQDVPEDIAQANKTEFLTSAMRLLEADRQAQKQPNKVAASA